MCNLANFYKFVNYFASSLILLVHFVAVFCFVFDDSTQFCDPSKGPSVDSRRHGSR